MQRSPRMKRSNNAFVAGRARQTVVSDLIRMEEDCLESEAWKAMVSQESTRPPVLAKPQLPSMPVEPADSLPSSFPAHGLSGSWDPVTTTWNAAAFRRALATSCFKWRAMKDACGSTIVPSQLRSCFQAPRIASSENVSWNNLLIMLFDLWHHVERHIMDPSKQTADLARHIFMQLELFSHQGGARARGTEQSDTSSILTSVKAYLSEFAQVNESDWHQIRRVRYRAKDKMTLLTTEITHNSVQHMREAVEETVVCDALNGKGFCMHVASREPVDVEQLPMMTLPEEIEVSQQKVFSWVDESYAHTVQNAKKPVWKLTLSMTWTASTMLEVDAMLSSRRPPRTSLTIETQPLKESVYGSIAGEMTLLSAAGIYTMAAICLAPRERDAWTWTLQHQ